MLDPASCKLHITLIYIEILEKTVAIIKINAQIIQ